MTGRSDDERMLARAIELAAAARRFGDEPFGAVLAVGDRVLEARNRARTDSDPTAHAELLLIRDAIARLTPEELAEATLYASTEPCAMCTGALYWAGIGRVVFDLAGADLVDLLPPAARGLGLDVPCREVLARGGRATDVIGPVGTAAGRAVHDGYWS